MRTFYPEVTLEFEDITKIATGKPYVHGDVISEATNNIFCRHGHTAMAHLHVKFDDHTLNRFIVIVKNVPISFKHEYRRPCLSSLCDVIRDVISMRNNFHAYFAYGLSIYDV